MAGGLDWTIADAQNQLTLARSADDTGPQDAPSELINAADTRHVRLTQTLRGLDIAITRANNLVRGTQAEIVQARKMARDSPPGSSSKRLLDQKIRFLEQMVRWLEDNRNSARRVFEEALERTKPEDAVNESQHDIP